MREKIMKWQQQKQQYNNHNERSLDVLGLCWTLSFIWVVIGLRLVLGWATLDLGLTANSSP